MRQRSWIRRDYTDTLLILGASQRDAEWAYDHLRRTQPELLLGYAIRLASTLREVEGLRVSAYIFTPLALAHGDAVAKYAVERAWVCTNYARVHKGRITPRWPEPPKPRPFSDLHMRRLLTQMYAVPVRYVAGIESGVVT